MIKKLVSGQGFLAFARTKMQTFGMHETFGKLTMAKVQGIAVVPAKMEENEGFC